MDPRDPPNLAELVAHVADTAGLPQGVARRVVEDVLAYHLESLEDFVARRHRELAAAGWKNPDIYPRLLEEMQRRPFRAPACTLRQIRRMIYG